MSKFSMEKNSEGESLVLNFSGSVDEDASFSDVEWAGFKKVIFDLDKVSAINSCGIREWIKWLKTAPEGVQIVYKNCPKVIVDQINMVAGFLPPSAEVESFYVPYYSDASGAEKMVLFKRGVEFNEGSVNAPETYTDPESGEEMEMDVIEAKYFKFLKKG